MRIPLIVPVSLLLANSLPAQDPANLSTPTPARSISGRIVYSPTGAPAQDAVVSVRADQGNYTLSRFEPGRAFIVMVRPRPSQVDPISDLPTSAAMRKHLPAPTFYPGSISVEGAQMLTLGDGEIREAVDVPVVRAPSLCIGGHTLAGRAPAALSFDISPETPTFGQSGNGGMYGTGMFSGKTGPDGVIRACGLTPGAWAIHVDQPGANFRDPPAFFTTAAFTLTDSDIHGVVIAASPRVSLPIEVMLDGPAPVATPDNPNPIADITVLLQSLVYAQHTGDSGDNKVAFPAL